MRDHREVEAHVKAAVRVANAERRGTTAAFYTGGQEATHARLGEQLEAMQTLSARSRLSSQHHQAGAPPLLTAGESEEHIDGGPSSTETEEERFVRLARVASRLYGPRKS